MISLSVQAVECATKIVANLCKQNRRTLDLVSAKCYYYYVRAHEMVGKLADSRALLHNCLRTATLRYRDAVIVSDTVAVTPSSDTVAHTVFLDTVAHTVLSVTVAFTPSSLKLSHSYCHAVLSQIVSTVTL